MFRTLKRRCFSVMTIGAVLLLSLVVLSSPGMQLLAATPETPPVHGLANVSTQRATLEHLRSLADPTLQGVLQALKEGALYVWKDNLLIFTSDGVFVDLDGKPLVDSAGQAIFPEDGLEQVVLLEENIPLVQRALDVIELFAPDPARRKSTALRLGNLQDPALTPTLARALSRETVAEVKTVLVDAVNKLSLLDPDPQVRRRAVEFFGAARAEAALSRLRELRQQETDPQVHTAVTQAVRAIEEFLHIRNAVGYVFNGISLASILLIMSLGLAITFGLMGIINMAHGEMLMLGSYTAYVMQEVFAAALPGYLDYFFLIALPLSVVVVGGVGVLMERGILRFLYGRPLESLLITWGIGMILQQGARLYFGDQTSVSPPTWFRGGWEIMPGLILPYSRMFIIVLSLLCLAAVYWLLYRSDVGLRVRSVMQNRDMASCMGISARTVDTLTFAMGTALAGLAGCALSLIGTVDPEVGKTYIVDSFLVVVLGGVGKLFGTVLAAFGVGMSNKFLEPAIGGTAAAVYAKVGILVLVIVFLQLKPTGLFPAKERTAAGMLR
jgi:urea transport system permease protein